MKEIIEDNILKGKRKNSLNDENKNRDNQMNDNIINSI